MSNTKTLTKRKRAPLENFTMQDLINRASRELEVESPKNIALFNRENKKKLEFRNKKKTFTTPKTVTSIKNTSKVASRVAPKSKKQIKNQIVQLEKQETSNQEAIKKAFNDAFVITPEVSKTIIKEYQSEENLTYQNIQPYRRFNLEATLENTMDSTEAYSEKFVNPADNDNEIESQMNVFIYRMLDSFKKPHLPIIINEKIKSLMVYLKNNADAFKIQLAASKKRNTKIEINNMFINTYKYSRKILQVLRHFNKLNAENPTKLNNYIDTIAKQNPKQKEMLAGVKYAKAHGIALNNLPGQEALALTVSNPIQEESSDAYREIMDYAQKVNDPKIQSVLYESKYPIKGNLIFAVEERKNERVDSEGNKVFDLVTSMIDYQNMTGEVIVMFPMDNRRDVLNDAIDKLIAKLGEYNNGPSSFTTVKVYQMQANFVRFNPLRVGCYKCVPPIFKDKKGILNIKNTDKNCFRYCVIASYFKDCFNELSDKERRNPTHYMNVDLPYGPYFRESSTNIIANDRHAIKAFEKDNTNIGIQLFSYEVITKKTKKGVIANITPIPLYSTPNIDKKEHIVRMLIVHNEDKSEGHLILIEDLALFQGQNKIDHTSCPKCFYSFTESDYKEHRSIGCNSTGMCKVSYPTEKQNKEKFKRFHNQEMAPLVIYADLESYLEKSLKNTGDSNLVPIAYHKCNSYGLQTKTTDVYLTRVPNQYHCKIDDNTENTTPSKLIDDMIIKMSNLALTSKSNLLNRTRDRDTSEPQMSPCKCCICGKLVTKKNRNGTYGVLHYNLEGQIIGRAHCGCNSKFRVTNRAIPVFFHNLSGYDGHFIFKEVGKHFDYIKAIPVTSEKFMSFTCYKNITRNGVKRLEPILEFKDSLRFLGMGLDVLTSTLKDEDLVETLSYYKAKYPYDKKTDKGLVDKYKLIKEKGTYPYEFMDCYEKLNLTDLPEWKDWRNTMKFAEISSIDKEKVSDIYHRFKCESMHDFHEIYLTSDVLLLCDLFEKFRAMTMVDFGIDPAYYVSAPSMAWDACMRKTGAKLELLTAKDQDIYNFIESTIRGGYSAAITRHVKSNSPDLKDYDPSKIMSVLAYLDSNNLYGYAMSKLLPTGNFSWKTKKEFQSEYNTGISKDKESKIKERLRCYIKFKSNANNHRVSRDERVYIERSDDELDYEVNELFENSMTLGEAILTIPKDSPTGYFFEVDMHTPLILHDAHANFPCMPINKKLDKDEISTKALSMDPNIRKDKTTKLIQDLHPKTKYRVHYRLLRKYIKLGIVITKIRRIVQFDQSAWLKPYIDFNTEKRKEAIRNKDESGKIYYKLLNNAVYGKSFENVRKRISLEITNNNEADKIQNFRDQMRWKNDKRYQDLTVTQLHKVRVKLNKPIYLGAAILDLSKMLMYKFHYEIIIPNVGVENYDLIMTDTDSMLYAFYGRTLHSIYTCPAIKKFLDLSGLDKRDPAYSDHNAGVLGMFKTELPLDTILEAISNRSKSYCLKTARNSDLYEYGPDLLYNYTWTNKDCPKGKGIADSWRKKYSHFEDFKSNLYSNNTISETATYQRIGHLSHNSATFVVQKNVYNCADTKRYIHDTEFPLYTVPYGHYSITDPYCFEDGKKYNRSLWTLMTV